jgi:hypothetical protein
VEDYLESDRDDIYHWEAFPDNENDDKGIRVIVLFRRRKLSEASQ